VAEAQAPLQAHQRPLATEAVRELEASKMIKMQTADEMKAAVDRADERAKKSPVTIYSWGLFYLSACAPAGMTAKQVEREVNRINVCGTTKGWTLDGAGKFSDGSPMPGVCDFDPKRKHWLFVA
jgi:hypothetical protein